MTSDDEAEILALMRAAQQRSRGYADFFGWSVDKKVKEVGELGVVSALVESMAADGVAFFTHVKPRCHPNDPPDCEGIGANGARVAIEVTELVDGDAIRAYKEGRVYEWSDWTRERFISALAELIDAKDKRFPHLKEPPYDGGYVVVVHCDEPTLSGITVRDYLEGYCLPRPLHISRALLILSYAPAIQRHPYFELSFNG